MKAPADLAPRIKVRPDIGCWEWQGYVKPNGYGQAHRNDLVHILMWEHYNGTVPPGLTLDHLCRNRRCCNPAHLEPVTARVNILRGVGFAATNAKKYRCTLGHPLVGKNVYLRPDRHGRMCRTCREVVDRRRRAANPSGRDREAPCLLVLHRGPPDRAGRPDPRRNAPLSLSGYRDSPLPLVLPGCRAPRRGGRGHPPLTDEERPPAWTEGRKPTERKLHERHHRNRRQVRPRVPDG